MASDKHLADARAAVQAGKEDAALSGWRAGSVNGLGMIEIYVAEALSNAEREGMRRGYELGFRASGEGWNGEYPFGDQNRSPTSSPQWVIARDRTLSIEITHSSGRSSPETDKTGEVADSPTSPVHPSSGA